MNPLVKKHTPMAYVTALALSLILSGTALAQQDATKQQTQETTNVVLENASDSATEVPLESLPQAFRVNVKKALSFDPGVQGLKGWVLVSPSNQTHIVYSMLDDTYFLAGSLATQSSATTIADLTQAHYEKYANLAADWSNFWPALEQSAWVADGAQEPKKVIYGFFDANCIYCHLSWLALEPYMKAGLQVRWLPVAILGSTSAGKAAALLQARDPRTVMAQGHARWELSGAEHAFPVADLREPEFKKMESNLTLMKAMGFKGTPAFVYQDQNGRVDVIGGMPELKKIREITGFTQVKDNPNPKLDNFR